MREIWWRSASALALLCALSFVGELKAQEAAKEVSIRSLSAPCQAYLVPKRNTTKGRVVVKSLDPNDIEAWLKTNPEIDPAKEALYLVGAPFSRGERKALTQKIRESLDRLGYKDVDLETIRRLRSFVEEERGVFSVSDDGTVEKLSGLEPARLAQTLAALPPEKLKHLVITGMPVFGSERRSIEEAVAGSLKEREDVEARQVELETTPVTVVKKFFRHPGQGLRALYERLRYGPPLINEDWQAPSRGELRTMAYKLVVPGALTFSVMMASGQPLKIIVPVTLVNAANSALAGTFRTFIGNWFSRSTRFFPGKWLKNVALTTFFTSTLSLADRGSMGGVIAALGISGWMNFFSTKWLTILFNTAWRAPLSTAVYGWERWRNESGVENELTRRQAAAVEKFVSYVMTQFYIYAIVSHSAWFKVASGGSHGFFDVVSPTFTPQAGETLLMSFNVGHAAMGATGILAAVLMRQREWLSPVGRAAAWLEDWENKIMKAGAWPVRKLWQTLRGDSGDRLPLEGQLDS